MNLLSEILGWTVIGLLGAVLELTYRNFRLRCCLQDARQELVSCYNVLPGVEMVTESELPKDILSGTVSDSVHATISSLQQQLNADRAELGRTVRERNDFYRELSEARRLLNIVKGGRQ